MENLSQLPCSQCLGERKPATVVCLCANQMAFLCSGSDCDTRHFNEFRKINRHPKYSTLILHKVVNSQESIVTFKKTAKKVSKATEGLESNLSVLKQFKEDYKSAIKEIKARIKQETVKIKKKILKMSENIRSKIKDMKNSLYEEN